MRSPWYVVVPAVMVGAATLLPLVYLLVRALELDVPTFVELALRSRNLRLLGNTAALTGLVLAGGTLIAVPLAWLVTRTDLRGRRAITWLSVTPLAVPGYVMAYALLGLGGYQGVAMRLFDVLLPRPSGLWGAAAALTLYTFPYIFLNVRSALLGLDTSLEESARCLGQRPAQVMWRVVLPQLRPALLAGWLVVSLYVLGDFGAVALMRFETFSLAIYTQYTSAFDRSNAALLSLMLLVITTALVALELRLLGKRRYARVGRGVRRTAQPERLGHWRWAAYLFVFLALGAAVGLPVLTLVGWIALVPPDTGQLGEVVQTFLGTAMLAVPAAVLTACLAIPVAIAGLRSRWVGGKLLERLVYLGYAVPPVALALALVMFAVRFTPLVYQTFPLLVFAYVVSYLALAIGPVRSGLLQVNPRVEETARSLGRGRFVAFVQTVLPTINRNILAGGALVLMAVMKELPMTYLLAPSGYRNLAVRVFGLTNEAMMASAAPFALAIVVFSSLFVGLLLVYEGRRTA
ncbi:MAG TPA: iron ABC transporter permease [Trueperaceae bacterium]|nr:iron ABC transporter permease [Trueperaceae bacterium]